MKVLIVEDDDEKLRDLVDFVQSLYPDADVSTAKSLHSGKRAALDPTISILLLDMTMRNFERSLTEDGGRPHAFAGREILRQMSRAQVFTPTIIVTQFDRFGDDDDFTTLDDLKAELRSRFPNYKGTVHYRSNWDTWRDVLHGLLVEIEAEK